jgi:hypothetical protein
LQSFHEGEVGKRNHKLFRLLCINAIPHAHRSCRSQRCGCFNGPTHEPIISFPLPLPEALTALAPTDWTLDSPSLRLGSRRVIRLRSYTNNAFVVYHERAPSVVEGRVEWCTRLNEVRTMIGSLSRLQNLNPA